MISLSTTIENMNPWMTKAAGAVLILFVGFIAGRVLGQLVRRMLGGIQLDKNVRQAVGAKFSLEKGIGNLVTLLIYLAAIIMTLDYLQLATLVLTIILVAIIVILVASFILAIRDLLPNLFAGITLRHRKDFEAGDTVLVKEVAGIVEEVSLLSTKLLAGQDVFIIPNNTFLQQGYHVKNTTSRTTRKKRKRKDKENQ